MSHFTSKLLRSEIFPEEKIIFFWKGLLSQWVQKMFYSSSLQLNVLCAEQAMMLYKARFFLDQESFDLILNESSPKEQQRLGRLIKNYKEELWEEVRFQAICQINYDKFSQIEEWKEILLLTSAYELVEASPFDRIWGIGMAADNPKILQRELWGRNLLGKALMDARTRIANPEKEERLVDGNGQSAGSNL
ncbi:MAG: NADAR family protein [Candidatus Cloacimonetes bacterium]|jgi:hypothetical protein|nr:NADAR family protein [Candidatus Cloacimonadota bacterium]